MTLSAEKRQAWIEAQAQREEAARHALIAGVEGLAQRQGWVHWLQFAARMPHYSLANQLLLASQLPEARMVMSADQWRAVSRWPARGSSALRIWAPKRGGRVRSPAQPQRAEDRPGEQADELMAAQQPAADRDRVRFLLVPVFDVSQTEGADLPEQPAPVPPPAGLAPVGMWDAMVDYAAAAGFTVDWGDTGAADGQTRFDTRRITIASRGSDVAQALTLAHEIGHMSLHADSTTRAGDPVHRGRAEVQAESVAFLVAAEYGLLDAAGEWHFDYLAHWAARVGTDAGQVVAAEMRQSATGVLSAARPLLAHLAEACVGHPDPLAARTSAPAAPTVAVMTQ